jgi:general stress protein YciG
VNDDSPADPAVDQEAPTLPRPKKPRGFAVMDKERVRAIASAGGRAAHAAGTAHEFSSEEARKAGRLGGTAHHVRRGRPARKVEGP